MSVDSILTIGRERRKLLMRSTCRITRPGGNPVFNPLTGLYITPDPTVIYEGICQIKPSFTPAEKVGSSADKELVVQSYDFCLPWDVAGSAPAVNISDTVTVLSGDDGWAVGKSFPVAWFEHADTRTHRRVTCFAEDRGSATYA